MQGVSINIFVKTGKKKKSELGNVYHFDLQGLREFKYDFLNNNSLKTIVWDNLKFDRTNYFFVKKDFKDESEYKMGFSTNELFIKGASGIKTERDSLVVHFRPNELKAKIDELKITESEEFRKSIKLQLMVGTGNFN